jgi:hypothetical protein
MTESPVLQKMLAQRSHELIVEALKERFKSVPRDVTKHLREITDDKKLKQLVRVAINCAGIDGFRAALTRN